jgi:catechol-2,3-dioxygenase
MELRPMLQVRDVAGSSRWYQEVIGLVSGHGGDEYEMLFAGDRHVLQLHRLDAHEHGFADLPPDGARGSGVSLWFETPDRAALQTMVQRAVSGGHSAATPTWNPLAHHYESALADPDGYAVVIHSPFQPEPDAE